ncbi:MAG: DUF4440 domain-containing protein [Novosphingobium sp.]|nr:DUF4440 domain-containing protein [Novosphingobium sp.]|tara:strand:+ start:252 stop:755 length:504 start_codon:yes stop_codon:yes gene_type:complete
MQERSESAAPAGATECPYAALRRLKARYFNCVDAKDWQGLHTVFSRQARFDRGFGSAVRNPVTGAWDCTTPPEPVIVSGRDAIIAMIRAAVETLWTIHRGHHAELALDAPDKARGLWAMSDELRDREGRLIMRGSGHYHETYIIEDGDWRIDSVRLTRLFLERPGDN